MKNRTINQIDREIEILQRERKEQSISVSFDIDKSVVIESTSRNLQSIIEHIKTLDIDNDIVLQEVEAMIYKIKSRCQYEA